MTNLVFKGPAGFFVRPIKPTPHFLLGQFMNTKSHLFYFSKLSPPSYKQSFKIRACRRPGNPFCLIISFFQSLDLQVEANITQCPISPVGLSLLTCLNEDRPNL